MQYRANLFFDLAGRLGMRVPARILEIGPKDGLDTQRLLSLLPYNLSLLDLPGRVPVAVQETIETNIEYIVGDVLEVDDPKPFDLIWCTGVLYHVKEQYRLIKRLYSWLVPGGLLVLESATIRRWPLRNQRCVEILYPPDPAVKRRYHLSLNVTHLPSRSAIKAWLEMAGFEKIERSNCHQGVRHRVAFIAGRPT